MNIISKVKQLFSKTVEHSFSASVTFYPYKIIVQTQDHTDGPHVSSSKLTILKADEPAEILGQTLRKHFNLTESGFKANRDLYKQRWEAYKKAAGFKTNKETYKDARHVSCGQDQSEISLCPTENNYNTGYTHFQLSYKITGNSF